MKTLLRATVALTVLFGVSSSASSGEWKDGVLFVATELSSPAGTQPRFVEFGLEPGKCSGQLVSPYEQLAMTRESLTFIYENETVVRTAGDDAWTHADGTKVEVCNKGGKPAVVVAVQFMPAEQKTQ